ncbi:hypothetical protein ES288_A12G156800v1 [Gossypium darwinii]|uniref:Uncharacterized protein n=1 Tax=Gossypium darwinii TaxID=34276 RepID=A0A5D2EA39_GOSDA|nr:hypothetical protein ES288_A12G156800v1 [Gossypium darwinii]
MAPVRNPQNTVSWQGSWHVRAWGVRSSWRLGLLESLRCKQKLLGFLAMFLFWAMGYWVRLFWVGLSNWAEVWV